MGTILGRYLDRNRRKESMPQPRFAGTSDAPFRPCRAGFPLHGDGAAAEVPIGPPA